MASFRELSVDGRSASSSSPKLKKAIDEIGERTRIPGHESVATAIELSQPSARNGVNQLQCIGRRDHAISAVPVAISTGTFICPRRFPMPMRCHASIAATWRLTSSGDNCARAAATISPNSHKWIRQHHAETARIAIDAPVLEAFRTYR